MDKRRIPSQTDTLRSTRSEQSPRFQRPHHSVSVPPDTPPLTRSQPHRHSISHATGAYTPQASDQYRTRSQSRDSLDQDSGIPDSEVTSSERASRSPLGQGSESDYKSLELDSLSVDESAEMTTGEVRETFSNIHADATSGATVIHVSGNIEEEETVETEVRQDIIENTSYLFYSHSYNTKQQHYKGLKSNYRPIRQ